MIVAVCWCLSRVRQWWLFLGWRLCLGLPDTGESTCGGTEARASADSGKSWLFDTVKQWLLLWPQRLRTVLLVSCVHL